MSDRQSNDGTTTERTTERKRTTERPPKGIFHSVLTTERKTERWPCRTALRFAAPAGPARAGAAGHPSTPVRPSDLNRFPDYAAGRRELGKYTRGELLQLPEDQWSRDLAFAVCAAVMKGEIKNPGRLMTKAGRALDRARAAREALGL